ncbi:HTH-type transcriptional regulator PrtR [Vibrio ruber DSM 16370]|uniref:HTH-type transcriptional regulator PrtR n=1 Tax=Vibrio ruber (strain DSM 16370 / JCM 11486 / BCRC 17186 / CECT 7878 / LMG 23124 / VR1) TaxID=1123498 RepID=A0A1R4LUI3_VIBR1|nr:S24 family peptidase [Vibrio ruber]SJN60103.1 HTH-type transcriptional regulator PrtR [Vibrio ruber DSM 16370]
MKNINEQLAELKGLTKTTTNPDLAKALGVSPKTIYTWKERDKIPEKIFLKAQQMSSLGEALPPTGYMKLDFYEQAVSAGYGELVISEEKSSDIIFSESFINNELGVNPKHIFLMPVKGDSMYPTLKNGSLVMVNRVEQYSGDGIYVFRFDGQLMVKRLQFSKNGLSVVSDNSNYEKWELSKEEITSNDFEIIGEVVWSGQRM